MLDPTLLIGGDFIMLRMALVDDLGGNFPAAILLQRIAWKCERRGEWKASREDLEAETRLGAGQVKRSLKLLQDRGYITSRRASAWDPTTVWSIVTETPEPQDSGDGHSVHHVVDESSITVMDKMSTTSYGDIETKNETTTTPTSGGEAASVKPGDAPEFDAFWAVYPRKVAKPDARRAYTKARGKGQTLEALVALAKVHPSLHRKDRATIPYPATWLNQEPWDDDLANEGPTLADQDRAAFGQHWEQGGEW